MAVSGPCQTGVTMIHEAPSTFSAATREWFRASFAAPTAAQEGAWEAIRKGQHTLVVAPTGSGKTLAAFLWALDRILSTPQTPGPAHRCRVVYVSPMKALAVDVERNLRSPLVGIGHAAARLGTAVPPVAVAVRSADTTAAERRDFARHGADVLITTPESLFLILTSQAREALRGVETVILDEVHAVAGTKRGAHLALTLERLDALLPRPAQRVGLSATVRPVEEVQRFLAGGRPVALVQPPSTKRWDLRISVPVEDMTELGQPTGDLSGAAAGEPRRASIWPHVEEHIVDLVAAHHSSLVFANSRRLAERLTARLNEIWEDRLAADGDGAADGTGAVAPGGGPGAGARRTPAELMAQAGAARGAPPLLARAHHGSVSREQRTEIEEELKAGRLPAVVATSSLELGIDMGAVDLVVQVEAPPSVASGLQRVGRAGHQVGAVSRGVFLPKHRGDLIVTAVVTRRMLAGEIEALAVPANPLDVLAQQVVAMTAMDPWTVEDLLALARRSAPFATLSRAMLEAVLDMLSGLYPSDEFAELRPRIVWDRATGTLTGRPSAQRLAVTSGGTIPDRGLFGVFLASGEGPGRRVGELDEEMVYESRVGDVFLLGTSAWRIEDITHDRVLVTPAPGQPGKLPFWKADTLGRPAELGRAVGRFVRELAAAPRDEALARLRSEGLDEWAAANLLAYIDEQRTATGHLPDDRTIVIERFHDELGDWQVALHAPFGSRVHAPWAMCVAARLRERFGVDVQAMHADDGVVLRLPDADLDDAALADAVAGAAVLDADEVRDVVTREIGGSALFAARFRECAARALLLPRRRPDRRQALWQQRQRSAQLLQVASRYPSFPIVLEAVREAMQDVFDVPALAGLMRDIAARRVSVLSVRTASPSPFARSLLFGYVAQYLYEGDSPLAERRAAALALDPELLAELLGDAEGAALADLLDPRAVATVEAELQHLTEDRRARSAEDLADLVRRLGPLGLPALAARAVPDAPVGVWLEELAATRRVVAVRVAGEERWIAVEDAGRLRDALGVALPVGLPPAFLGPVSDPLADLVARFARTRGPFTTAEVAAWLGIGTAVARPALERLAAAGRLARGDLRPAGVPPVGDGAPPVLPAAPGAHEPGGPHWCDVQVLQRLRRRSLAALRSEVEPVPRADFARYLPAWQGVGGRLRGREGLLRAVEQLAGAPIPASALESLVLPARVPGYAPALLDDLTASGEVVWQGAGTIPGNDGWLTLHLAESAPLTLSPPGELELTPVHAALLAALERGGGWFFRALSDAALRALADGGPPLPGDAELVAALWDLVWAGRVTNDGLGALRTVLAAGGSAHRRTPARHLTTRYGTRPSLGGLGGAPRGAGGGPGRPRMPSAAGPPTAAGRWSVLPAVEEDVTLRALARAELLLDRYGVVTRGSVEAEAVPGGFAGVYRVLARAEEAGRVRRGYFIEGLGAAQFATTGAIDRLRAVSREETPAHGTPRDAVVLAATDPASAYGAALDWPDGEGHRPGRKAGALVTLVEGRLVAYLERGGRTALTWTSDPADLTAAARGLAATVRDRRLDRLTVERIDGAAVVGGDHPFTAALRDAGFSPTPKGVRLRA